jgi:hypothetical protein
MSLIQTLRTPRIFDIALFDLILSIVAIEILFRYMWKVEYLGAALAVPIGILIHALLGINTTLNYKLGISCPPER